MRRSSSSSAQPRRIGSHGKYEPTRMLMRRWTSSSSSLSKIDCDMSTKTLRTSGSGAR